MDAISHTKPIKCKGPLSLPCLHGSLSYISHCIWTYSLAIMAQVYLLLHMVTSLKEGPYIVQLYITHVTYVEEALSSSCRSTVRGLCSVVPDVL